MKFRVEHYKKGFIDGRVEQVWSRGRCVAQRFVPAELEESIWCVNGPAPGGTASEGRFLLDEDGAARRLCTQRIRAIRLGRPQAYLGSVVH